MFQQATKTFDIFVICALRVYTYEVSVYTLRTFMKCTHVCAAQKAILTLYQIIIKKNLISLPKQMK